MPLRGILGKGAMTAVARLVIFSEERSEEDDFSHWRVIMANDLQIVPPAVVPSSPLSRHDRNEHHDLKYNTGIECTSRIFLRVELGVDRPTVIGDIKAPVKEWEAMVKGGASVLAAYRKVVEDWPGSLYKGYGYRKCAEGQPEPIALIQHRANPGQTTRSEEEEEEGWDMESIPGVVVGTATCPEEHQVVQNRNFRSDRGSPSCPNDPFVVASVSKTYSRTASLKRQWIEDESTDDDQYKVPQFPDRWSGKASRSNAPQSCKPHSIRSRELDVAVAEVGSGQAVASGGGKGHVVADEVRNNDCHHGQDSSDDDCRQTSRLPNMGQSSLAGRNETHLRRSVEADENLQHAASSNTPTQESDLVSSGSTSSFRCCSGCICPTKSRKDLLQDACRDSHGGHQIFTYFEKSQRSVRESMCKVVNTVDDMAARLTRIEERLAITPIETQNEDNVVNAKDELGLNHGTWVGITALVMALNDASNAAALQVVITDAVLKNGQKMTDSCIGDGFNTFLDNSTVCALFHRNLKMLSVRGRTWYFGRECFHLPKGLLDIFQRVGHTIGVEKKEVTNRVVRFLKARRMEQNIRVKCELIANRPKCEMSHLMKVAMDNNLNIVSESAPIFRSEHDDNARSMFVERWGEKIRNEYVRQTGMAFPDRPSPNACRAELIGIIDSMKRKGKLGLTDLYKDIIQ